MKTGAIVDSDSLFCSRYLVLNGLFVIWSSTVGTCTLVIGILQTVEAELTYLET